MAMLLDLGQYDLLLKESEQLLEPEPGRLVGSPCPRHGHVAPGQERRCPGRMGKSLVLADKAKDEPAPIMIMQGIAKEMGAAQVMPRVLERARQEPAG